MFQLHTQTYKHCTMNNNKIDKNLFSIKIMREKNGPEEENFFLIGFSLKLNFQLQMQLITNKNGQQ